MNLKRSRPGAPRRRGPAAAAVSAAALLAIPVAVQAAHWPQFGGDAGHSGNQPVDAAQMPVAFRYTQGNDGQIVNSIVTSAGADRAQQVLAYGTYSAVSGADNDVSRVYIRKLANGELVTAPKDVDDGSDDSDALGPPTADTSKQGVSFVDTSAAGELGQLFVVHNDTNRPAAAANNCSSDPSPSAASNNDISIAQFDEKTGELKKDVAIGRPLGRNIPELCTENPQVTDGYTVESSPVITPPLDASGKRWLFFLARKDDNGAARLFGVEIDNAGSPTASIKSLQPQFRDVEGANTLASPTLLYLNNPGPFVTGRTLYVAVPINGASGSADIRTYQVGDITDPTEDGPTAGGFTGVPQTISVPVTANGMMPGQEGSGAGKAPALYVAFAEGGQSPTTTVRKLEQKGSNSTLTAPVESTPVSVEGHPAPALAVTSVAAGDGEQEGRVVLTTDVNLILLDSETTTPVERLQDINSGETPLAPANGFSRNTALVSGGFIFLSNNDGQHGVLRLSDGEPVPPSEFNRADANSGADYGLGQPSLSRGFAQFLSDKGLFVYETSVNEAPTASFTASPNPAQAGQTVSFASQSSDPDGSIVRHEWDLDGNGSYETDTGQTSTTTAAYGEPGTYNVKLRVTDNRGASAETAVDVVVNAATPANQPPSASFTASPNPVGTGDTVTFDASASKDPEGRIASYQWDFDGNGTFETNTGTTATVSRVYPAAGVYNVRLRVTDAEGASADAVQQLTVVGRAAVEPCSPVRCKPGLRFKVRPKRDTTVPIRFTFSGRLVLPRNVKRSDGCRGRVSVQTKVVKKTISTRRTRVNRDCTWKRRVTFTLPRRFRSASKLRFVPRFLGNDVLTPRRGKVKTARIR